MFTTKDTKTNNTKITVYKPITERNISLNKFNSLHMFRVISNTVNKIIRFQFSDTYAMDSSEHWETEKING